MPTIRVSGMESIVTSMSSGDMADGIRQRLTAVQGLDWGGDLVVEIDSSSLRPDQVQGLVLEWVPPHPSRQSKGAFVAESMDVDQPSSPAELIGNTIEEFLDSHCSNCGKQVMVTCLIGEKGQYGLWTNESLIGR
jgi:hypothetical protein